MPLTVACAKQAPEPAAPAAVSPDTQAAPATRDEPMSELEALEHDLDVSEQRLERHLSAGRNEPARSEAAAAEPMDEEAQAPEDARAGAPPPPPSPAPPAAAPVQPRADDICSLSCRALASMRRSQEGICKLVPGDTHCSEATRRVERAAQRVADAGCVCDE